MKFDHIAVLIRLEIARGGGREFEFSQAKREFFVTAMYHLISLTCHLCSFSMLSRLKIKDIVFFIKFALL